MCVCVCVRERECVYSVCKEHIVMLFLALCRVFKSKEPLSFGSTAHTEVVRKFPMTGKVLRLSRPE